MITEYFTPLADCTRRIGSETLGQSGQVKPVIWVRSKSASSSCGPEGEAIVPADKQYGAIFNVRVPLVLANQVNATNALTGIKISDVLRPALLRHVRDHLNARPVHIDDVGWIDPVSLDFDDPEHPDTQHRARGPLSQDSDRPPRAGEGAGAALDR